MPISPAAIELSSLATSPVFYTGERVGLVVTGDDRLSWLNGVLSSDLRNLDKSPQSAAVYGCALDRKGKLLGDVLTVLESATGSAQRRLTVWVPPSSRQAIHQLWESMIVMEDVELAPCEELGLLAIQGSRGHELASQLALRPASYDDVGCGAGAVVVSATADLAAQQAALEGLGARKIELSTVSALRIQAARPTYGIDVDARNYIQEAGLQERAVSFTKGCYLGQEVVCMLQMRGHVSRKLVMLRVMSPSGPLPAGSEVRVGDSTVGTVTSSVQLEGAVLALALVKANVGHAGQSVSVLGHAGEVAAEAH